MPVLLSRPPDNPQFLPKLALDQRFYDLLCFGFSYCWNSSQISGQHLLRFTSLLWIKAIYEEPGDEIHQDREKGQLGAWVLSRMVSLLPMYSMNPKLFELISLGHTPENFSIMNSLHVQHLFPHWRMGWGDKLFSFIWFMTSHFYGFMETLLIRITETSVTQLSELCIRN